MYRLTYLVLAPWSYFVLFATTGAAISAAWSIASRAHESDRGWDTASVGHCVLIAGLPPALLFLLHDVANWSLGLGRYSPGGIRRYILLNLYGVFLIGLIGLIVRRRQHGGSNLKALHHPAFIAGILADLGRNVLRNTGQLRTQTGNLAWFGGLILMFLPPTHLYADLGALRSSPLNQAVNSTAAFYVNDFHHLPECALAFDRLLDETLRKDLPEEIAESVASSSVRSLRGFVLSTIGLRRLGLGPAEIKDLVRHLRACGTVGGCCSPLISQADALADGYPMFRRDEAGLKTFGKRVRNLCEAMAATDRVTDWDLELDPRLSGIVDRIDEMYMDVAQSSRGPCPVSASRTMKFAGRTPCERDIFNGDRK
jgi:hypothetical protein